MTKVVDWNGFTPDPSQTFEFCISARRSSIRRTTARRVVQRRTVAWDNCCPSTHRRIDAGTVWVVAPTASRRVDVGGDVIQLEYNQPLQLPNLAPRARATRPPAGDLHAHQHRSAMSDASRTRSPTTTARSLRHDRRARRGRHPTFTVPVRSMGHHRLPDDRGRGLAPPPKSTTASPGQLGR